MGLRMQCPRAVVQATLVRRLGRPVLTSPRLPRIDAWGTRASALAYSTKIDPKPVIYKSKYPAVSLPNVTLPEFLLPAMEAHRDQVCWIDGHTDEQLTYGQVVDATYAAAAGFAQRGIDKDSCVALYTPNTPYFYVALMAIAMNGGKVTLVNPQYSPGEVEHQLNESGATQIIVGDLVPLTRVAAGLASKDGPLHGKIRDLFSFGQAGNENSGGIGGTSLAKVIEEGRALPKFSRTASIDPVRDTFIIPFSSGTTGMAKGVCLSHKNLVANTLLTCSVLREIKERLVACSFLPMFHIYGCAMNFAAMYSGTVLVNLPRFDMKEFLEDVQKYQINYLIIVPPIAVALAKHPIVDNYNLSSVETIFSGAAPLSDTSEAELLARLRRNRELHGVPANSKPLLCKQGYGLTETSPAVALPPPQPRPGSVGMLAPNTEGMLCDPVTGQSLPEGGEGELVVRGPQVMLGYLNNPEATKQVIRADGFLRTGDVARIDKDGFVYITDRVKELIKYKGFQVPPAELEALLLTHPDISDAAVIGKPDQEAGELPLAFIVARQEGLTATAVEEYIAARVAPHKRLRGGVQFVKEIPKTAAGKILRRKLKETLVGQQA